MIGSHQVRKKSVVSVARATVRRECLHHLYLADEGSAVPVRAGQGLSANLEVWLPKFHSTAIVRQEGHTQYNSL